MKTIYQLHQVNKEVIFLRGAIIPMENIESIFIQTPEEIDRPYMTSDFRKKLLRHWSGVGMILVRTKTGVEFVIQESFSEDEEMTPMTSNAIFGAYEEYLHNRGN